MGPLIHPPEGDLARALSTLEPEESWALAPANLDDNPHLWTPGIKYGVQPGSFTHMTEFFGPVLGVMVASNLDHAITLVNQTGYGLTAGLESLDRREQAYWKNRVRAGNLYINRGTTGAITLRQPFGGMGKSAVGPGLKTGGPDYVAQFLTFRETGFPELGVLRKESVFLKLADEWHLKLQWGEMTAHRDDIHRTIHAIKSYLYHVEHKFSEKVDFFHLRGQDNILRYLPIGKIVIRVHPDDSLFEVLSRIAAALISGCSTIISIPEGMNTPVSTFLFSPEGKALAQGTDVVFQSDPALIDMIPRVERIRYAAPERVPERVLTAAAGTGFYISRTPVLMEGRIELLQYFRQQAICTNYHRYGNLGERGIALAG
jgi:RHH-type proline utilization regulon transcriptional repressor/proline dehydrogenase/delta 1-pyrroline-5-carboxylate dehydrogenase